ncbi:uncharacterized protein C8Q71DRAFT_726461 [Rhodofomes roseus]|uniref:Uncharacterized protein n=1 Tax=Rhodofomes roseus TaxID=34475 RepID=A0ABQ8K6K8_9APHY|nr:uncharacterized protein C8Q71DRAFT_726461 [Rhodofomes roseus]KAH9832351.1 hypothetical protein C8Q71DRAFT_726461 [Rhodofomes roseus]
MSPPLWATPPQAALLTSFIPEHLERQLEQKLLRFWPKLFTTWFAAFPEERVLFPDMSADELLSEEQKKAVGAAIAARKKQLKSWYGNRSGQKGRKARAKPKVSLKLLKPSKKRSLAAHELYSQKNYDEKIKPILQARIDSGEISTKERLKCSVELAKTLLAQEPAEVREEIEAEAAKLRAARNALGSEGTKDTEFDPHRVQARTDKDDHYRVVDDMGSIFTQFFDNMHAMTGGSWFFFTMGCGVNPDGGYRFEINTHSSGVAAGNISFSQANPEAVAALGKAFLAWVRQAMSPQIYAHINRALNRSSPDSDDGGEGVGKDGGEGGEGEDKGEGEDGKDKDEGSKDADKTKGEDDEDKDKDEDEDEGGGEGKGGGEGEGEGGGEVGEDCHDKRHEASDVLDHAGAVAGEINADALSSHDGMGDGQWASDTGETGAVAASPTLLAVPNALLPGPTIDFTKTSAEVTPPVAQSTFDFTASDFMETSPIMNPLYPDPTTFVGDPGYFSTALVDAVTPDAAYGGYMGAGFTPGLGGMAAMQGGYDYPLPAAGGMYADSSFYGSYHPGNILNPAATSFNGHPPALWFNNPYNLPPAYPMPGLGTAVHMATSNIPSMTAVPRAHAALPPVSSSFAPTFALATAAMPSTPAAAAVPSTPATPPSTATAPTAPAALAAPIQSVSVADHPVQADTVLQDTTSKVNNAPSLPATQGASAISQQQPVPTTNDGPVPVAVPDGGAIPTTRPQRQHRLPDRFRDSVDGAPVGKKENMSLDKENPSSKGTGAKTKKRNAGDADAGANVPKKKHRGK